MEVLIANQNRADPPRLFPPVSDVLRVCDLSVHFRLDTEHESNVLAQISFAIAPGEIVGLLGESGSGKTTTALAILQLLPESARVAEGSVQFTGENLIGRDTKKL